MKIQNVSFCTCKGFCIRPLFCLAYHIRRLLGQLNVHFTLDSLPLLCITELIVWVLIALFLLMFSLPPSLSLFILLVGKSQEDGLSQVQESLSTC